MKNEKVDTRNIQIYSDVLDYMIMYCFEKSGDNYIEETDTYLYDILMKKVEETEVPEEEEKEICPSGVRCFDYVWGTDIKSSMLSGEIHAYKFTYQGGGTQITTREGTLKTISISKNAGDFNIKAPCISKGAISVGLYITDGLNNSYACGLITGKTYWINIRNDVSDTNHYNMKVR